MKRYRFDNEENQITIVFRQDWWQLSIDGRNVGEYASAEAAAYDVYAHNTGDEMWDEMTDQEAPETLEEWDTY